MPYGCDTYGQGGYFNTNYRPPMGPMMAMQSMQQMQPMQQMAPAPEPTSNVTWIYVNGIAGARDHIVQPGHTAWMMDNNDPVLYIKAVDNMGSATLRSYSLTEIPTGQQAAQPQAQQVDLGNFATRDDLARLEGKLDRLIGEIGGEQA